MKGLLVKKLKYSMIKLVQTCLALTPIGKSDLSLFQKETKC